MQTTLDWSLRSQQTRLFDLVKQILHLHVGHAEQIIQLHDAQVKQTKEKQELLADLEQNLGTLKDKFEKLRSWWSNAATQMRCNLLRIKIDHQQHSEGGPPPNQQYSDDQTPSDENGNADLVLPIQPSDTDQGLITNLQTKVEELQELIRVLMGLRR
eukprot:GABU01008996.1.p1 GENE.GABU01008996.1~~GABU01008996.1.p1  ORF type:complete len:157 (+),score=21.97 GABU01008996.1:133-603(+)